MVPFVVDSNKVYIDNAQIKKGNVLDLTVGNKIQSDVFSDTSGWQINRDGTAYFQAAAIRGILSAEHIDSNVRNWERLWIGSIYTSGTTDTAVTLSEAVSGFSDLCFVGRVGSNPENYSAEFVPVAKIPTRTGARQPGTVGFGFVGGDFNISWQHLMKSGTSTLYIFASDSSERAYLLEVWGIRSPSAVTPPPTNPTLSLASTSDFSWTKGTAVNVQLPAATASTGSPSISYSLTRLPSGLSFSSSTRRITGTPTTSGTGTLTYTASATGYTSATDSIGLHCV